MAKLKDGFYKLTASSIGSDLLVLLAGGGAKPIADFATTTDLSGYLPLTGGTLTGVDPILTLNCTDASPRIVFKQNVTTKGSIRFNDNNLLSVLPKNSPTWYEFLHTGNYSSYALPLDGNAASATKLQTARTIWGQSFDGSGNIDGTLTINGTYGSYTEGIRIKPSSAGWSTILLGGADLTSDSGTSANSWSIHSYLGNFYINRNGANNSTGYELCNYNGNWGIGTMSPGCKLDVVGAIQSSETIYGKAVTVLGNTVGPYLPNINWYDLTGNTGFHVSYRLAETTKPLRFYYRTGDTYKELVDIESSGLIKLNNSIVFTGTVGSGAGTYLAGTGTDGLFLAANESGKKVFLESTNQDSPWFRNKNGDYAILHTGNFGMGLSTITKSIRVTTSWLNTGISGDDLGTGSFVVQIVSISDNTNGGLHWSETYTGLMTSFSGATNDGHTDEIPLHRAGHAPNSSILYLRTAREYNSGRMRLQIAGNYNMSAAQNITFKFRRII